MERLKSGHSIMAFDKVLSRKKDRLDGNCWHIPLQALVLGRQLTGSRLLGVTKVLRMQRDNERVCMYLVWAEYHAKR
jgi:hypothetical protein